MTETLLALVPDYGGWLLMSVTFLSCLALPVPSSFLMLAGGAFGASGDLALGVVFLSALAGALLGDQAGYLVGKSGGKPLIGRLAKARRSAALVARARAMLERRGIVAVFLTRWLFSPLGPYVNFIGGAVALDWRRFTLGSVAGETVWVLLYTSLGYGFANQISEVAQIASDLMGLLAALLVTILLGRFLFRRKA